MNDLLTDRGRAKLALFLIAALLLMLFGTLFAFDNEAEKAMIFQIFAALLLVIVLLKLDIDINATDLKMAIDEWQKKTEAARQMQIRKLTFKELSWWKKALEITFLVLAGFAFILALLDWFGIGEVSKTLPGSSVHVPRFIFGIFEFLFGWALIFASRLFRYDFKDLMDFSRFKNVIMFPKKDVNH